MSDGLNPFVRAGGIPSHHRHHINEVRGESEGNMEATDLEFCLDYINKHPTMDHRTKLLLAEVVKGEMSKEELVEYWAILARLPHD